MFLLKPKYLFLNYTTLCNSRCATCRLWAGPQFTLPTAQIERIGRFIDPMNLREVYFTGGEPLLPENAVEVTTFLARWRPGVAVTGATNSLDPPLYLARVEAMQRAGVWANIIVSLNGTPATYDRTRGVRGNYHKCIQMIEGLRAMRALAAINILDIPPGANEPGTTEADRRHVQDVADLYGVPVWRSPILRQMPWFGVPDDGATIPPFECHGAGEVLAIMPNGDIMACQEPRPELKFGNLADEKLDEWRAHHVEAIVLQRKCQPCGCCTAAFTQGLRCVT